MDNKDNDKDKSTDINKNINVFEALGIEEPKIDPPKPPPTFEELVQRGARSTEKYLLPPPRSSGYGEIDKFDTNLLPGIDRVRNRARNQRLPSKFSRTVANLPFNIAANLFEYAGYAGELVSYGLAELTDEEYEADFTNALTEWAKEAKDPFGEVHRRDPDAVFDLGDWAWWFEHGAGLVESVASFLAAGVGIGKGAMWATGKLAQRVTSGMQSARGIRAVGTGANLAGHGFSAASLAYFEGAMSGAEMFDQVRKQVFEETGDAEEASRIASEAAALTAKTSTAIVAALNVTSFLPIFQSRKLLHRAEKHNLSRRPGETSASFADRMAQAQKTPSPATQDWYERFAYAIEIPQEAAQEISNMYAEETGRQLAGISDEDATGMELWMNMLMTEEGALGAILGGLGGAGQTYGMMNLRMHRRAVSRDGKEPELQWLSRKQLNQLDESKTGITYAKALEKDIRDVIDAQERLQKAINEGNTQAADIARLDLFDVASKRSIPIDGGEALIASLREIAQVDNNTDLFTEIQNQIDQISEGEMTQEAQTQIDQLTEQLNTLQSIAEQRGMDTSEGMTEAMHLGLADSMKDNEYIQKAEEKISEVQEMREQYLATLRKYDYGDEQAFGLGEYVFDLQHRVHRAESNIDYIDAQISQVEADIAKVESTITDELIGDSGQGSLIVRLEAHKDALRENLQELKADRKKAEDGNKQLQESYKALSKEQTLEAIDRSIEETEAQLKSMEERGDQFAEDIVKKATERFSHSLRESYKEGLKVKDKQQKKLRELTRRLAFVESNEGRADFVDKAHKAYRSELVKQEKIQERIQKKEAQEQERAGVEEARLDKQIAKEEKAKEREAKKDLPEEGDTSKQSSLNEFAEEAKTATEKEAEAEHKKETDEVLETAGETDAPVPFDGEPRNLDNTQHLLDSLQDISRRAEESVDKEFHPKAKAGHKIQYGPTQDYIEVTDDTGKTYKVTTTDQRNEVREPRLESKENSMVGEAIKLSVDTEYSGPSLDADGKETDTVPTDTYNVPIKIETADGKLLGYLPQLRWLERQDDKGNYINVADFATTSGHNNAEIQISLVKKIRESIIEEGSKESKITGISQGIPIYNRAEDGSRLKGKASELIPDPNFELGIVKAAQVTFGEGNSLPSTMRDGTVVGNFAGVPFPMWIRDIDPTDSQVIKKAIVAKVTNDEAAIKELDDVIKNLEDGFDFEALDGLANLISRKVYTSRFTLQDVIDARKTAPNRIFFHADPNSGFVHLARPNDGVIYTTNPRQAEQQGYDHFVVDGEINPDMVDYLDSLNSNLDINRLNKDGVFEDIVIKEGKVDIVSFDTYNEYAKTKLDSYIDGRNTIEHSDTHTEYLYFQSQVNTFDYKPLVKDPKVLEAAKSKALMAEEKSQTKSDTRLDRFAEDDSPVVDTQPKTEDATSKPQDSPFFVKDPSERKTIREIEDKTPTKENPDIDSERDSLGFPNLADKEIKESLSRYNIGDFTHSQVEQVVGPIVYSIANQFKGKTDLPSVEESLKDAFDRFRGEFTEYADPDIIVVSPEVDAQRAASFEAILTHWDEFAERALSYLKAIGYETGLHGRFEGELSDYERKKYDDKSRWYDNSKDTASGRLKLFLSQIPRQKYTKTEDGEVILEHERSDWLGLKTYIPLDEMYDKLTALFVDQTPTIDNFKEILAEAGKEYPPYATVLKQLNNLGDDTSTLAEFQRVMSTQYIDMVIALFEPTYNDLGNLDGYRTRPINSDRNSAIDMIYNEWVETMKSSDLIKNHEGTLVIDPVKAKEIKDRYISKMDGQSPLRNKPVIRELLESLGIRLHEATWDAALRNNTKAFSDTGTLSSEFAVKDGAPRPNTFLHFLFESLPTETPESFDLSNPLAGETMRKRFRKLASYEFNNSDKIYTSSFNDINSKTIYPYQMNTFFSDRIRDFKINETLRNDLKGLSFSKFSRWLDNSDDVTLEYIDGLKNQKTRRGNSGENLGKIDGDLLSAVLYFGTVNQTQGNFARFQSTTKADKTRFPVIRAPRVPIDTKIDKDTGKFTELRGKSRTAVRNLVRAEFDRVYNFRNRVKKLLEQQGVEIQGYWYKTPDGKWTGGADKFILLPELNADIARQYVDLGVITMEEYQRVWAGGEPHLIKSDANNSPAFDIMYKVVEARILREAEQLQQEWKDMGIVTETFKNVPTPDGGTKKVSSLNTLLDKGYMNYIAAKKYPNMHSRVAYAALDFTVNYHLNMAEEYMVVSGDPAQFWKPSRTGSLVDDIRSTIENLNKRLAKDIAPRSDGLYDSPTFTMMVMRDPKVDSREMKALGKAYGDMEIADAQEYTTVLEHLRNMKAEGKITPAQYNELSAVVKPGRYYEFTAEQIKTLNPSPTKPVYVGDHILPDYDVNLTTYTKSSAFPLLPQFTKGFQIDNLRKAMEKSGVDRASFTTANKLGAINPVEVFKGRDILDSISIPTESIREMDRSGFGFQQEVPVKDKDVINVVSQANKLLFAGIRDVEGFVFEGQQLVGRELEIIKEQIRNALLRIGESELYGKLGIELLSDGTMQFADYSKVHNLLKSEAESRGWSISAIEAIQLTEDKQSFVLPLSLSANSGAIESLLLAQISDITLGQEMHGYSYVQGSSAGLMTLSDAKRADLGIVTTKEFDGKGLRFLQEGKESTGFADIIIPWRYKDSGGNLLDINDFLDDNGVIDSKKLPENARRLIGLRIPNQGHNSMLPMRVVGYLPTEHSTLAIVPEEIVAQMGSDFDVDKLYTYQPKLTYDKGTKSLRRPVFNVLKEQLDPNKTEDAEKLARSPERTKIELERGLPTIESVFREERRTYEAQPIEQLSEEAAQTLPKFETQIDQFKYTFDPNTGEVIHNAKKGDKVETRDTQIGKVLAEYANQKNLPTQEFNKQTYAKVGDRVVNVNNGNIVTDPNIVNKFDEPALEPSGEVPSATAHIKPLPFSPSTEQSNAITSAIKYIQEGPGNEYFVIQGKAGTGKTSIAQEIVRLSGTKHVDVAALSHKAKSVIQSKFESAEVVGSYHSIASLLGMKMDLVTGEFFPSKGNYEPAPIESVKLLIIDEASMVNEEALEMVMDMKPSHAKVIFLGDIGQLPPIRSKNSDFYRQYTDPQLNAKSPVFDPSFSIGQYKMNDKAPLTERFRQGEESNILPFADYFWDNSQSSKPVEKPVPKELRENSVTDTGALLFSNRFNDIKELVADSFKKAVEDGNPNHIKVVSYRNKTRQRINNYIHHKLFGKDAAEYNKGELIIFNDTFYLDGEAVAENATEGQIVDAQRVDILGIPSYSLTIESPQKAGSIEVPVVAKEGVVKFNQKVSGLFARAKKLKGTRDYYTALQDAWSFKRSFADIDYGYAITSHKSQGSTYDMVVVHENDIMAVGPITARQKSESIYTAMTRAANIAIMVSPDKVTPFEGDIEAINNDIKKNKEEQERVEPAKEAVPDTVVDRTPSVVDSATMLDFLESIVGSEEFRIYIPESGIDVTIQGADSKAVRAFARSNPSEFRIIANYLMEARRVIGDNHPVDDLIARYDQEFIERQVREFNEELYNPDSKDLIRLPVDLDSSTKINNLSKDQLMQKYFEIFESVLSHPEMYDALKNPLDKPDLTNERDFILSVQEGASDIYSPASYIGQRNYKNNQRSGQKLIGIGALANTLASVIQDKQKADLRIQEIIDNEAYQLTIPVKVAGANVKLVTLSGKGISKYEGEIRTKLDNISLFVTAAVDNANMNVLGPINWNVHTAGSVVTLLMLESDKGQSVDLGFAARFTSQPIIRELVEEIERLSSASHDQYVSKPVPIAIENMISKYKEKLEGDRETDWAPSKEDLTEMLSLPPLEEMNQIQISRQMEVLNIFRQLHRISEDMRDLQQAILTPETDGIDNRVIHALRQIQEANEVRTGGLSSIANTSQLMENYDGSPSEQAVSMDAIYNNAKRLISTLLPEYTTYFDPMVNSLQELTNRRFSNDQLTQIWKSTKRYLNSNFEAMGLENVSQVRERLLFGDENTEALAARVEEAKATWGSDNFFLKRLIVEKSTKPGVLPSTIVFKADTSVKLDDSNNSTALASMLISANPVERNLAKDLVLWDLVTGGVQGPVQFSKHIPPAYLRSLGLNESFQTDFDKSVASMQVLQHNPTLAPMIHEDAPIFKAMIKANDGTLQGVNLVAPEKARDSGLPFQSEEALQYPEFISTWDANRSKFVLMKQGVSNSDGTVRFDAIPTLGMNNISEYHANVSIEQSIFDRTQTKKPAVPVRKERDRTARNEVGVLLQEMGIFKDIIPESAYELKLGVVTNLDATLTDMLEWVQFDESNKPLSDALKSYLSDTNIQIRLTRTVVEAGDTRLSAEFRTEQSSEGEVSFLEIRTNAISADQVQEVMLHEAIHAATSKALRENKLPEVQKLTTLYNHAKRSLETTNALEVYQLKNVHEFVAFAMTNKEFQAKLNEVPFENKTAWDRFKSLINQLITSILEATGLKVQKDSVLEQTVANVVSLMETQAVAGQRTETKTDEGDAPPSSISDTSFEDLLGYPEFGELDPTITKAAETLRSRISNIKKNISESTDIAKKQRLQKSLQTLQDDLTDLVSKGTAQSLVDVATAQTEWAKSIASDKRSSDSEFATAKDVMDSWDYDITKGFLRPAQLKHDNPINDALIEAHNITTKGRNAIEDALLTRVVDLVNEGIPKEHHITAQSLRFMKDIGFVTEVFFDASQIDNQLAQYMFELLTTNAKAAGSELLAFDKKLNEMLDKMGKQDWEVFKQLDTEGNWTGDFIDEYSAKYYNLEGSIIRSFHGKLRKADTLPEVQANRLRNKAYKDYYSALNELQETVDLRMLNIDGYKSPIWKSKKEYVKHLENTYGKNKAEAMMDQAQMQYQEYNRNRKAQKEFLEIQYLDSQRDLSKEDWVAKELKEWESIHSPMRALDEKFGTLDGKISKYTAKEGQDYLITVPRAKDKRGKDTGFYDQNFENLTPVQREFYNFYINAISELQQHLPTYRTRDLTRNFFPRMRRDFIEELNTGGVKGAARYANERLMDSITAGRAAQLQGEQLATHQEIDPQTNLPKKEINILFLDRSIDTDSLSFNVPSALRMFAGMALNYKWKSSIEDRANLLMQVVRSAKRIEEKGGKVITDKDGGVLGARDGVTKMVNSLQYAVDSMVYNEKRQQYEESNIALFDTWNPFENKRKRMEMREIEDLRDALEEKLAGRLITQEDYETEIKTLSERYEELGGKNLVWGKVGDRFVEYSQLKGMGYNLTAGIANVGFGVLSNLTWAASGRDFSGTEITEAYGIIMKELTASLFTGGKSTNKVASLVKVWDVLFEVTETEYGKSSDRSKRAESKTYNMISSTLSPYMIQRRTEFTVQAAPMVAQLRRKKIEVTNQQTGETETISLWDAYDNDGNWKKKYSQPEEWAPATKPGEALNEFSKLRNKIIQINKYLHGNYDPNSPFLLKKWLIGRMFGQFRSWIPYGAKQRFGPEQYDRMLGRTFKGRYTTLYDIGFMDSAKGLLGTLLRMDEFAYGKKGTKARLRDIDIDNIKMALREMQVLLSLIAAGVLLKATVDELDEDTFSRRTAHILHNQFYRVEQDIYFYLNPRTFEEILRNPISVMQVYKDFEKVAISGLNYITDSDYEGSRVAKDLGRALPLANQIIKTDYLSTNLH